MKELINSIADKITQKREQGMRKMEQRELLGRNLRFIFCRWNAGAQGLEEVYHYMHIFLFPVQRNNIRKQGKFLEILELCSPERDMLFENIPEKKIFQQFSHLLASYLQIVGIYREVVR